MASHMKLGGSVEILPPDPTRCGGSSFSASAAALPLLPNCDKAVALQRFWDERGAVVYWHPQKTGGTTMCTIARREHLYTPRFWSYVNESGGDFARINREIIGGNCRAGFSFEGDALCESAGLPKERCRGAEAESWSTQAAFGRLFFAMEPAGGRAPRPLAEAWSANEWLRNASSEFWASWSHVITVRDPAERMLSDLRQKDVDVACRAIELTEDACITRMLSPDGVDFLREAWQNVTDKRSTRSAIDVVENRLLINYLVVHLSGTYDDLCLAKRNLRLMSLVIDLKDRPGESYFLLKRLYNVGDGEAEAAAAPLVLETIAGREHSSWLPFKELYPEVYLRVKEYLWKDFELWRHALEVLDVHARELGFASAVGENTLPPAPAPVGLAGAC